MKTRAALVYFTIYAIASPVFHYLVPVGWPPRSMTTIVGWLAEHVFHAAGYSADPGSGDRLFDWIQMGVIAAAAVAVAGAWTLVDRSRRGVDAEARALWAVARLSLGAVLFGYGSIKLLPVQFVEPTLVQLVQPLGAFPRATLYLLTVGASPSYEVITGAIEVFAALLLFVPRTAWVGGAVALMSTGYVLLLNLTYDITNKLFAVHLVVMALIVLAAGRQRRPWRDAVAIAGVVIAAISTWHAVGEFRLDRQEAASPSSPLHGIWNIVDETIDGQRALPSAADAPAWRRFVFEEDTAAIQRMDDAVLTYAAAFAPGAASVTLDPDEDGAAQLAFGIRRVSPDRVELDARLDDRTVIFTLARVDPATYRLRARQFHWVQEARAYGQ